MDYEYGLQLLVLVSAGLIGGWLAGIVTRGAGFGLPGNILVALTGGWLMLYSGGGFSGWADRGGYLAVFAAALFGAFLLLWLVGRLRS